MLAAGGVPRGGEAGGEAQPEAPQNELDIGDDARVAAKPGSWYRGEPNAVERYAPRGARAGCGGRERASIALGPAKHCRDVPVGVVVGEDRTAVVVRGTGRPEVPRG